jgi:hypothetical protein
MMTSASVARKVIRAKAFAPSYPRPPAGTGGPFAILARPYAVVSVFSDSPLVFPWFYAVAVILPRCQRRARSAPMHPVQVLYLWTYGTLPW